jgi:hypothetical protein
VAALVEWQGALVAAGATAIWQRAHAAAPWQPLLPLRACALSAAGATLWLAGPAGLAEITGDLVKVHAITPLTGLAVQDGIAWLASGHGPLARVALAATASAMPASIARITSDDRQAVSDDMLHALRIRARWARWLPDVAAQARWSRARDRRDIAPAAPESGGSAGARSGAFAMVIWLTWSLDHGASALAARSWP